MRSRPDESIIIPPDYLPKKEFTKQNELNKAKFKRLELIILFITVFQVIGLVLALTCSFMIEKDKSEETKAGVFCTAEIGNETITLIFNKKFDTEQLSDHASVNFSITEDLKDVGSLVFSCSALDD